MSIKNTEIKVKIGHSSSDLVHVTTGLRKSDVLPPIIFNIILEKIIRKIGIVSGGYQTRRDKH